MDEEPEEQYEGIRRINARDWLLGIVDWAMQIHGNNIYKQKIHLLIAVKVQDKLQKYVVPFMQYVMGAGCPVDIRLAQTVAFTNSSQKY